MCRAISILRFTLINYLFKKLGEDMLRLQMKVFRCKTRVEVCIKNMLTREICLRGDVLVDFSTSFNLFAFLMTSSSFN